MSKKSPLLLEISLPSEGGSLRFKTIEEIEQWCTSEHESLQFVRLATRQDNSLGNLWNEVAVFVSGIQQRAAELRRHASTPEALAPHLSQINSLATEFYSWSGFAPKSPRREFLLNFVKDRPLAAAYAFSYLARRPFNMSRPEAIEGILEAFLFSKGALEHGARTAAAAHLSALDNLRTEFAGELAALRTQTDQYKSELNNLSESSRDQFAKNAEEQKAQLAAHEQASAETLDMGKKHLEDIATAYDAKMALQAPVTYWEAQRRKHLLAAIGFAAASVAWAACSLAVVYLAAERLLTAASGEVIAVAGLPIPKVPIWHFALLVLLLVFAFWFARIFVRVLLSQIHLHSDASERVTMAKTYIALLREGQGPQPEDRLLILQTLFRPATTGIVRDDAVPPHVLEWLTRSGSK